MTWLNDLLYVAVLLDNFVFEALGDFNPLPPFGHI